MCRSLDLCVHTQEEPGCCKCLQDIQENSSGQRAAGESLTLHFQVGDRMGLSGFSEGGRAERGRGRPPPHGLEVISLMGAPTSQQRPHVLARVWRSQVKCGVEGRKRAWLCALLLPTC